MKPDALNEVASDKRARLTERLELYIRAFAAVDLDQIYALMPRACTHGLDRGAWRSQARVKSPGLLRRFDLDEVYAGDYTSVGDAGGEKWIARGCGTYERGNKTVTYKASVNLVLIGDEWYICGSGVAVEGKHNTPMTCGGT